MRDTPPEIEQRVSDMMATRTPSERAAMVGGMFHAAKTLVLAGIQAQQPDLTPAQLRAEFFRRMYGDDFSEEEVTRICAYLMRSLPESSDSAGPAGG